MDVIRNAIHVYCIRYHLLCIQPIITQRAAVYSEQQVQIEQELWLTRSEHQVTLYRLQQYQAVRDQVRGRTECIEIY